MGASLNQWTGVGNLGGDPDGKFLPSGQCVVQLNMACNRRYKAADGEWKDELTWVPVEVWGKQAESCLEYLKKGSQILVEGRLKLEEWEKDGQKRSRMKVIAERVQFLGSKKSEGEAGA